MATRAHWSAPSSNLVENALHHVGREGRIEVTIEPDAALGGLSPQPPWVRSLNRRIGPHLDSFVGGSLTTARHPTGGP